MNRKHWRQNKKGKTEVIASLHEFQEVVDDANGFINEISQEHPIDENGEAPRSRIELGDRFISQQGPHEGRVFRIEHIDNTGQTITLALVGRREVIVDREIRISRRLLMSQEVFVREALPVENRVPELGDTYRPTGYNEIYTITQMERYSNDIGFGGMRFTLTSNDQNSNRINRHATLTTLNNESEWERVIDTSQDSFRHTRTQRFF